MIPSVQVANSFVNSRFVEVCCGWPRLGGFFFFFFFPRWRSRRTKRAGSWPSRCFVKGRVARTPPAAPALGRVGAPAAAQTEHRRCRCWIAKPCATGCTASMPKGRRGSATARRRAGRDGWTRRSWPSSRRASKPAPIRRRTVSSAGVWPTCAAGRRLASRSATKSAAWARSCARSASPVSRRARRTPGPTPSGKPSSKKLPELIAAAVGEKGAGKRLALRFQML